MCVHACLRVCVGARVCSAVLLLSVLFSFVCLVFFFGIFIFSHKLLAGASNSWCPCVVCVSTVARESLWSLILVSPCGLCQYSGACVSMVTSHFSSPPPSRLIRHEKNPPFPNTAHSSILHPYKGTPTAATLSKPHTVSAAWPCFPHQCNRFPISAIGSPSVQ